MIIGGGGSGLLASWKRALRGELRRLEMWREVSRGVEIE